MATTEVADALTLLDCITEANVYGVEVPGNFHCASSLCYFWHDSSREVCEPNKSEVLIIMDWICMALLNTPKAPDRVPGSIHTGGGKLQ